MSTENLKSKTSEKPLENLQEVLERFSVPGGFSEVFGRHFSYIFDVSTIKGIKNRIVVIILVMQRADYTLPSTLEFGACTIR